MKAQAELRREKKTADAEFCKITAMQHTSSDQQHEGGRDYSNIGSVSTLYSIKGLVAFARGRTRFVRDRVLSWIDGCYSRGAQMFSEVRIVGSPLSRPKDEL